MKSVLDVLSARIEDRSATVAVVGLGYVGLPVASSFARAGFRVMGVDVDAERVATINQGRSPIKGAEPGLEDLIERVVHQCLLTATTDASVLGGADFITINVQTPVDDQHHPDYGALDAAAGSIGNNLTPGTVVVVESTVAPGTTEQLVAPVIEKASGLELNKDFFLGACPERVMPGRLLENIETVPRVCGGSTPEVADVMKQLYHTVVKAEIDTATITVAELVKVTENAYRDVQIAFANEVAQICADLGEDVWQVRELVNKVPERNMHRPGGGVGGHCIPKDSWLLTHAAVGPIRLLPTARTVNDEVPRRIARIAERACRSLQRRGVDPKYANTVLILGYSYLPDSDDVRNSPSAVLEGALRDSGIDVLVHDPVVPGFDIDLDQAMSGAGVAVRMVAHSEYEGLVVDGPFLVDAYNLAPALQRLNQVESDFDV